MSDVLRPCSGANEDGRDLLCSSICLFLELPFIAVELSYVARYLCKGVGFAVHVQCVVLVAR